MNQPSRRGILAGALAAGLAPGRSMAASWTPDSLHAVAAAKGLAYGSAVNITPLRRDPVYGAAIARECGIVVAENEMKFVHAWPREAAPAFAGGDETAEFARVNGQRLRGHALIWHEAIPDWARAQITRRSAEGLMRRWIGLIAGRHRGRIEAWDVVNEICGPNEGRPDGLRASPWLDALGSGYVDLAFAILEEVDPGAAGVWNENDLELQADWIDARRRMVLRSLEAMLRRGVPIRRLGLQGHIYSTHPLDAKKLRDFLREVAGLGLAIEITEFDVDDRAYPADLKARDAAVSDFARRFLDVVLDEPAVINLLTWDITDANTWLNTNPQRRRRDGLPHRALPLDAASRRTPLWSAMHRAFSDAPAHRAARARLRGG
ncbi:endo-1,4-beta-xylanase [Methylobacterium iners]|uniref:Beta-xylanase n=1 Tax=Methylobacterium iners TaxID=418707 RepID=A0ABQ4S000_9HYPH|nr:endo-1,4-beta-xylanase [Methylobacterium iners]GJD95264.1 Endo-1,4-beta-xylanase Z [Methylobacterium iners]